MNARELIVRINDLEARAAAMEARLQDLEANTGKAEHVKDIDDRLQSMEDWRQTFERPARDKLQIRPMTAKAEVGDYQPGTKR